MEFGEPKIVVVDDGLPEHWFSRKYPEPAKHCKVIDLEQHDVGVGVGRNTAIDAAETEFIFLLDDDQIVTPDQHLDRVYQRFMDYDLDILAVRQGDGGRPMLFSPLMNGTRIWMHRGERKSIGETSWCDMVIRWDEDLKVDEHWDFFWRAKVAGVKVGVATDHIFPHNHVDPPAYKRHRPVFLKQALRKHNLRKVLWR